MKKPDRFLISIVAGIVLLVAIALIVALRQSSPTYQLENSAEGVAYNYLLALQKEEYNRAYGYLSPTLPGYPLDNAAFIQDFTRYRWQFRMTPDMAIFIRNSTSTGDLTIVHAAVTEFNSGDLFGGSSYTTQFDIDLREEGGEWKIVSADSYWASCWNNSGGCK